MLNFILLFLIFSFYSQFSQSDESSQYHRFFEAMTYSSAQWLEDDFGTPTSETDVAILKKHSPRFSIHKKSCAPMDFYQQYVPLLYSKNQSRKIINGNRENLKRFERNFAINWQLRDPPRCIQSNDPPLYAASWQEKMKLANGRTDNIRVLKYSFAFYKSGLPFKQSLVQKMVRLLGDPETWHYLDIHGAVFYLLDPSNKLFSVVLAQHNHFRSYLVGKDVTEQEAKNICFAIRSNEPYFCGKGTDPTEFPTAPTFEYIRWIVSEKNRPFLGAWDVIPKPEERKRIIYHLAFLPTKDPLITSWVSLGPELKIWGFFSTFYRKAPPGTAIFNTPKLKALWKTAQYFYFDPNDDAAFSLHEKNMNDFLRPNIDAVFKINALRFTKTLSNEQ